ncbi:uncharacterized protein F5147DRAFT_701726 [Suillus discolor]|uniref:Secreted protein n=1 Tax=Suillus discolor TaxID=1912936 RepID=A0A9P7JSN0_9AGAM|nr:uncharacterized protein F5147DRAFT_701726 [Suillus discolor]KAG2105754.1 hypothetical protein F5147DRAFT_701726 [Suillus discolor]
MHRNILRKTAHAWALGSWLLCVTDEVAGNSSGDSSTWTAASAICGLLEGRGRSYKWRENATFAIGALRYVFVSDRRVIGPKACVINNDHLIELE